jgi:hypothetical protein
VALVAVEAFDVLSEFLLGGDPHAVAVRASALTDMSDTRALLTFFTTTSAGLRAYE